MIGAQPVDMFPQCDHVETVCLLTYKDWKGLGKAWNQGVSVAGVVVLRMMGALLLFSMGTYPDFRQRQGCGYDFTFLQKRENDFTILVGW